MKTQSIRRFAPLVALAIAALAAILASPAAAAPDKGRYIVVFKDSVGNPGSLAKTQAENRGAKLSYVYRYAVKGYAATLTKRQVEDLRSDSRVKFVARDHRLRLFEQTTPTGIDRIFAPENEALDIDEEDDLRADVDVAVIDTGIDHEHPDLNVVGGADCATEEEGSFECKDGLTGDYDSHGTHVAGTVGAIDNGEGVVGVAPGARLWSVQVSLFFPVETFESSAMAGVDWVTATREDEDPENDIDVANMSFGCTEGVHEDCEGLPALDSAISGAVEEGVVLVAAAGNESTDASKTHPASHPDVITVSALSDFDGSAGEGDDPLASFSNYGETVEVAAPGVSILSTVPGESYGTKSGTSMASPHVAGAAALLASQGQPESKSDVEAIRDTIIKEGNFDWEDTSGDGIQEPLLDVGDGDVFAIADPSPEIEFGFAFGEAGSEPGQFVSPFGVAVDAKGAIWVTDTGNDRIQKFSRTGEFIAQFGEAGSGNGEFNGPVGISVDAEGAIWVTDTDNNRIQKFNAQGEYLDQFGEEGAGNGQLFSPYGVATDSAGNVWVADSGNYRVQKFSPQGEYLTQFGELGAGDGQFNFPLGIEADSKDNLWVTDYENDRVQKFNEQGEYLDQFGEAGTGDGQFNGPFDIAVGPAGDLWVTDDEGDRFQKFSSGGTYLDQFGSNGSGSGMFHGPAGIAVDSTGSVWVVDRFNHRVQNWSATRPIAAYSFSEGQGTTLTDSAGNHDGTIEGATWTEAGKYGGALDFDGTDDLVTVADAADLDLTDSFTLEAWVRPDSGANWRSVLTKASKPGGSEGAGYTLFATGSGKPEGYVSDSGTNKGVSAESVLPLEAWSHLAFTSDGTDLRLYVDGSLAGTAPAIAAAPTSASLEIGHIGGIFQTYFDGLIDEVRIYDAPLSEAQIQADRDTPVEPIAAYSFNEGEGATLTDSAGNHDGTVSGASWTTEGKYGSALNFDGTDDLVTVADHAELDLTDSFTIEAWVRPDALGNWSSPISKASWAGGRLNGYTLAADYQGYPTGIVLGGEENHRGVADDSALPTGLWSHLAFTSDGTTLKLYLDGQLAGSESAIAAPATAADLHIGHSQVSGNKYFDGLIDEVRIYDAALPQSQIEADRDAGV